MAEPSSVQSAATPPHSPWDQLREALSKSSEHWENLAQRHARRYRASYQLLFLLAPFSMVCSVLPRLLDSQPPASAWKYAELILLMALFACVRLLRRSGWKDRWLSCRQAAEQIRYLAIIAPFIRLPRQNWYLEVAQATHSFHEPDPVVTQACLEAAPCLQDMPGIENEGFRATYSAYLAGVVRDQLQYHRSRAVTEQRIAQRSTTVASALLIAAFVAAVATAFVDSTWAISPLLIVIAGFSPSVASSVSGFTGHRESKRLKLSSDLMLRTLSPLLAQIERGETPEALRHAALCFVTAALSESESWYTLQKTSRLSV